MKLQKVISKIFPGMKKAVSSAQKSTAESMPRYDSKNATIEEFRNYVQYLAKNNINKTFYEPDRFVTEAERKLSKNGK